MNPFLKTCLIAVGAAVVFFGVDAIWTRASGEPSGLAEGVVIAVIVFFAVRIGYKSDDRRPGMPESPDDSQTPAP